MYCNKGYGEVSMNQQKHFVYDNHSSRVIKGVAIIMMFVHHFFGFPKWVSLSNTYVSVLPSELLIDLGKFFKICVGLFVFSSGYAMYVKRDEYKNLKYCIKKLMVFLIQYWMIQLFFIFVGICLKEPLPTISRFILNMFGLCTATGFRWSYNNAIHPVFAWYVSFYIIFTLLQPSLQKISKFNFWIDNILYAFIFHLPYFILVRQTWITFPDDVMSVLLRVAMWGHVGMIGFLFAKYDIFSRIDDLFTKLLHEKGTIMMCIVLIIGVFFFRMKFPWFVHSITFDTIYTPILIYSIVKLSNLSRKFQECMKFLGKYSMNLWFLHAIFFTPNLSLQWLAYVPKYPIMIIAWTLTIMLMISIPFAKLQGKIVSLISKKESKIQERVRYLN